MSELNEDIGYLKAKSENAENQIKNLYAKQDATHIMVADIHALLKGHIEKSESNYKELETDISDLQGDMDFCKAGTQDCYQIERFVVWIGAGFAFLWSSIWKVLDKVFLG